MRTRILLASAVAITTALGVSAAAAANGPSNGIDVKPWTYQGTGSTDQVAAQWQTHQGLPDAGNANQALYLQKFGPTADDSSGGASVSGVAGTKLSQLGFDYRNDGHCGAGAPRFNVVTTDGITHFFGCVYGSHTVDSPAPGWTRVRQTPDQGFPAVTPDETVQSVDIVFDEGTDQGQGFVYLDNIDYNGILAGKPGLAK